MPSGYILDSYALLAFLQGEPGAKEVEDLIAADDTEITISIINLGEVFYILAREFGEETAADFEKTVFATPKIKVAVSPWERVRAAARLKALEGLSFADCFAASLAQELDAMLVTGDSEFAALEGKKLIRVLWLPTTV